MPADLPITTPNLILRAYTEADRAEALRLMGDPDVGRYLLAFPRKGAAAEASFSVRLASGVIAEGVERIQLAITHREDGRFLGEICLINVDWARRRGELGYMLVPGAQGRGHGAEAASAMLRIAFETLRLRRVIANCDDRNIASWRIMERLGMRREAHFIQDECLKGEWINSFIYAILADEWHATRLSDSAR